jgi:anti-sigma B factor antagonist
VSNLEVDVREDKESISVALAGELDISETPAVQQALMALEERRPPLLVMDLRGLTFLDSSGLRLILEADLRARRTGRRLTLVRGPETVHRVFLIALLEKRLDFVDDPAEIEIHHEDDPPPAASA